VTQEQKGVNTKIHPTLMMRPDEKVGASGFQHDTYSGKTTNKCTFLQYNHLLYHGKSQKYRSFRGSFGWLSLYDL